jgi:hypothetical protein
MTLCYKEHVACFGHEQYLQSAFDDIFRQAGLNFRMETSRTRWH